MQTSNHVVYSTKVWLTSAFIAPVLISLFFGITESGIASISLIPFMIGFGMIFSIPNWIILMIAVWQINKLNLSSGEKKTIIMFIAFFLTLFLFLYIFQGEEEILAFSIPYHIILIFGIWYYKLIPPIKQIEESPISKKIKVLEDILDDENY